jgi:hypothetical protein
MKDHDCDNLYWTVLWKGEEKKKKFGTRVPK